MCVRWRCDFPLVPIDNVFSGSCCLHILNVICRMYGVIVRQSWPQRGDRPQLCYCIVHSCLGHTSVSPQCLAHWRMTGGKMNVVFRDLKVPIWPAKVTTRKGMIPLLLSALVKLSIRNWLRMSSVASHWQHMGTSGSDCWSLRMEMKSQPSE